MLATLPDGWQATGMPVQFSGGRQGMYGEVRTDQWVVHVYVRSCRAQKDEHLRHVIAHELGHAHDVAFMGEADREEYKAARGIPASTPWFGCSGCADLATPAGDYAEVYGQWLRAGSTNRSQLAGDAGPGQLADLAARFFSRA